jgi:hypothetical protein
VANARYLSLVILLGVLTACPVVTYALIQRERDRPEEANVSQAQVSRATSVPMAVAPAGGMAIDVPPANHVPGGPAVARASRPVEMPARSRATDPSWFVRNAWVAALGWLESRLAWVVVIWLLKKPIHFVPRDVEREVIVAKGRYQFHPLGDLPNERFVHLGTESLVAEDGGGGGSGSLTEMLDWLGNRVSRLAIDETGSPNERVQWRDHLARPMNEIAANTDEGRALLKRLLENVAKQTSLTFHHERRRVTVWFVTRER